MSVYDKIPKTKSKLLTLLKKFYQVKTQDEALHTLVRNHYRFNPRFRDFMDKELNKE